MSSDDNADYHVAQLGLAPILDIEFSWRLDYYDITQQRHDNSTVTTTNIKTITTHSRASHTLAVLPLLFMYQ